MSIIKSVIIDHFESEEKARVRGFTERTSKPSLNGISQDSVAGARVLSRIPDRVVMGDPVYVSTFRVGH